MTNVITIPKEAKCHVNQLHDELIAKKIEPTNVEQDEDGTIRLTFKDKAEKEKVSAEVEKIVAAHKPKAKTAPPDRKMLLDALKGTSAGTADFKKKLEAFLETLI